MSAVPKFAPYFRVAKPSEIEGLWPIIEGGIARALDVSDGESTVEDTREGLIAGRTSLGVMQADGALLGVVFKILAFDRFKVARILLAFGRDMAALRTVMEAGERWALEQGCSYVEGWAGTPSRARLFGRFGYGQRYIVVRKKL